MGAAYRRRRPSVNQARPTERRRPTQQSGTEAERTAYTPPRRRGVHRVVEPRHRDEEPDNTRTQERESSRTVIQLMPSSASIAKSLPRRKPQAARTGGKKHSDRATAWPSERKPASHRTTIINSSIIAGWALHIRWFLLPNTLRSEEAFILLFVDSGCRQRPTEDTLFILKVILSELRKTATILLRYNAR
jgi:hypothetical protein